jgi:serine/threonine protein kinase
VNLDDRVNKQKYKYEHVDEIYEFFEMVGQGAFSHVYRAKFIPTGQIIAVKVSLIYYLKIEICCL